MFFHVYVLNALVVIHVTVGLISAPLIKACYSALRMQGNGASAKRADMCLGKKQHTLPKSLPTVRFDYGKPSNAITVLALPNAASCHSQRAVEHDEMHTNVVECVKFLHKALFFHKHSDSDILCRFGQGIENFDSHGSPSLVSFVSFYHISVKISIEIAQMSAIYSKREREIPLTLGIFNLFVLLIVLVLFGRRYQNGQLCDAHIVHLVNDNAKVFVGKAVAHVRV